MVYRNFVRESVRRCVLEWQDFEPDNIRVMAQDADIPEVDQEQVIAYIGREFRGLHEGNVIRYKLRPANLDLIKEK
ncbi:MAG: hypothetical protein OXD01_12295 [Gammaproteobacteria bacterium]|nr:hypothetical protein [Gammaproteobacteria bacterium]